MAIPTAERPPKGLDARWLGVWRNALKTLKDQGSWQWWQRPLLDEYVFALQGAENARDAGRDTIWDRHARRALALADRLGLAAALRDAEHDDEDPFAILDGGR